MGLFSLDVDISRFFGVAMAGNGWQSLAIAIFYKGKKLPLPAPVLSFWVAMGGNGWQSSAGGGFWSFVRYSSEYLVSNKNHCPCLPLPRGVAMGGNGSGLVVDACSWSMPARGARGARGRCLLVVLVVDACSWLLQQNCVCKLVAIATKLRLQVGCVFFGGVGWAGIGEGLSGGGVSACRQRCTASPALSIQRRRTSGRQTSRPADQQARRRNPPRSVYTM